MQSIVFIAKTNLNNDGRILNELKILQNSFENLSIDFILLADKPLKIGLGDYVKVFNINLWTRHNRFLRFFTVFVFTFKALILMFKLKPEILHAQDSETVLPVLIYRLIKGKNFTLIYDDHEIPNENETFQSKIITYFEAKLMKKADYTIFANEERMEILKEKYGLKNKCSYFLNLPYFEEEEYKPNEKTQLLLTELENLRVQGIKFIIHQGVLTEERGKKEIAKFARLMPDNFKILLLGGNIKDFEKFLKEFNLKRDTFYFVGSVNYLVLPKFWEKGISSIVIYLPTYLNNKLCAPNRLYISVKKGIPVIVNKDNPVLNNFIKKYKCGFYIEDFKNKEDFMKITTSDAEFKDSFQELMIKQIEDFVSIYQD